MSLQPTFKTLAITHSVTARAGSHYPPIYLNIYKSSAFRTPHKSFIVGKIKRQNYSIACKSSTKTNWITWVAWVLLGFLLIRRLFLVRGLHFEERLSVLDLLPLVLLVLLAGADAQLLHEGLLGHGGLLLNLLVVLLKEGEQDLNSHHEIIGQWSNVKGKNMSHWHYWRWRHSRSTPPGPCTRRGRCTWGWGRRGRSRPGGWWPGPAAARPGWTRRAPPSTCSGWGSGMWRPL